MPGLSLSYCISNQLPTNARLGRQPRTVQGHGSWHAWHHWHPGTGLGWVLPSQLHSGTALPWLLWSSGSLYERPGGQYEPADGKPLPKFSPRLLKKNMEIENCLQKAEKDLCQSQAVLQWFQHYYPMLVWWSFKCDSQHCRSLTINPTRWRAPTAGPDREAVPTTVIKQGKSVGGGSLGGGLGETPEPLELYHKK